MEKFFHLPALAGRLDLAREATALLRGAANCEIAGVSEEVEERDGVTLHLITILNEQGAAALHRPCGRYLTYETPRLEHSGQAVRVAEVIADGLRRLLPPLHDGCLLLAGLGNPAATPDALGPAVVQRTYATRHIFTAASEPEGLARVATLAPGVLGCTGLETAEVLASVCARLRPAAVVAVDALAAASVSRVGVTVQLTDSGIVPGSGVGDSRTQLNGAALGCPLVALGVPTVVDTAAIISETLTALGEHWQKQALILPPQLDDAACDYARERLLSAFRGQLMVTPRDIDRLIDDMAEVIACALALAVHPACTADNCYDYIH